MSLGSDFAGVEDLTWDLEIREGVIPERLAYLEAIACLLLTPVGAIEHAPNAGLGIHRYLSAATSGSQVAQDVAATAHQDPRTTNVSVNVLSEAPFLSLRVTCYTAEGVYPLIVTIDKLKSRVSVAFDGAEIVPRS